MQTALTLTAADGASLPAKLFCPEGVARGGVVLSCALGVPQSYYARFAQWLSEQGYEVLTYDYRGIGEARPASLKDFDARLEDWGRLDFAAARAALRARAPSRPLLLIGHSWGGQALAFLDPDEPIAGAWLVAAQLAQGSLWPLRGQVRMQLFWRFIGPLTSAAYGYVPKWAGLGGDVPKEVVRQWGRWGLSEGYYLSEYPELADTLASLDFPLTSAALTDDLGYAPPKPVDALVALMPRAQVRRVDLSPSDGGGGEIGHFGFFRPKHAETLWPRVVADFEAWTAAP